MGEILDKTNGIKKNKLRVSWKSVNLQDYVWKNLYRIIMRTILQERVTIHCSIIIWTQIYSYSSSHENFRSKSSSGQRMGETWKDSDVGPDKCQKYIWDDRWSKDEGRKSSFCLTDEHMSFEECRIGDKASKIQRSSCTPRRYCERWFWILCSIQTRIISITNESSKSHGYHIKTVRERRTSSWCSISLYRGKNGRYFKIIENFKIGMSNIWIRLPRHEWSKLWSSMEDPVVPLERNLYGHLLAGLLWERQFEKILQKHGWEKIPNWECLFVHREKGLFLFVHVDDIKLTGRKQNIDSMWKVFNKEVYLGESTSFLDDEILECTQRQYEISKDIVINYRVIIESRISVGATEKLPHSEGRVLLRPIST